MAVLLSEDGRSALRDAVPRVALAIVHQLIGLSASQEVDACVLRVSAGEISEHPGS